MLVSSQLTPPGLKQLQVCILLIPQCGKGEMIFPVVPTEVPELNLIKISLVGTHAIVDAFCAPPSSVSCCTPLIPLLTTHICFEAVASSLNL